MHLFYSIRSILQLDPVRLRGLFSNGGLQYWRMAPDLRCGKNSDDQPSLRLALKLFILNRGPCPIDKFAIEPECYDFQRKSRGTSIDWVSLASPQYKGDASLRMSYNLRSLEFDTSEEEEEEEEEDEFAL